MADDVLTLFDEFAVRRVRGERPDVREYLERAGEGADELRPLLDRLLASTPPPPADEATVAAFEARLAHEPPLLALRVRRGLRRDDLVDALVQRLGLDARTRAKVKRYVHQLETGLLEPQGVSGRVFAALRETLRAPVEELVVWRPPPAEAPLYLRARAEVEPDVVAAPAPPPADEWDEVDALFRGGER